MMRQIILRAIVILSASNSVLGQKIVWTETFDTGVGRLDQTTGNGGARYVWNSSSQAIDASYFRYSTSDMRYADLGVSVNLADVAVGFNTVVRPTFGDGQSVRAVGRIGFLNPLNVMVVNSFGLFFNDYNSRNEFKLKGFDNLGNEINSNDSIPYSMGNTYYVEAFFDRGDSAVNIWEGTDDTGVFLGSISMDIGDRNVYVSGLGLLNTAEGGGDRTLNATIYEISYTVPEPSTISLLSIASVMALGRRRRSVV